MRKIFDWRVMEPAIWTDRFHHMNDRPQLGHAGPMCIF